MPTFPDELRKLEASEEVIGYLSLLKGREKRFLDHLIECKHIECVVAEKWKEKDKSRWREVGSKEELDKGITPFGDERKLLIDFYKEKGIDIANPTEEDAEEMLSRKRIFGLVKSEAQ